MKTISRRAQYILDNYRFEQQPDGRWRAVTFYQGRIFGEIIGPDREAVRREARCRWGHFNFEDEAEAFARIFPA